MLMTTALAKFILTAVVLFILMVAVSCLFSALKVPAVGFALICAFLFVLLLRNRRRALR
jgi:hypothetical protein